MEVSVKDVTFVIDHHYNADDDDRGARQRCDRRRLLLCHSSCHSSSLAFAHKQVSVQRMFSSLFPISVLSSNSNLSTVDENASSTVETSGEDEESEIRSPATKGTSEEEEKSLPTNSSENEGLVDLTSEPERSTRTEDESDPKADDEVGRRTTGKRETSLNEAEEDASRRTTDLWPENPIKKRKLDGSGGETAFVQPLMMVDMVDNRTISSL